MEGVNANQQAGGEDFMGGDQTTQAEQEKAFQDALMKGVAGMSQFFMRDMIMDMQKELNKQET